MPEQTLKCFEFFMYLESVTSQNYDVKVIGHVAATDEKKAFKKWVERNGCHPCGIVCREIQNPDIIKQSVIDNTLDQIVDILENNS
jgi:hypothetical protein